LERPTPGSPSRNQQEFRAINIDDGTDMAGEAPGISDDPALHALARSMRATFTYDDLWPELPPCERDEYLGYALAQREWLRRLGCMVTTGCASCTFRSDLTRA
jgi:hypothetical protein